VVLAGLLLNLHPLTLSGQGVPHQFREVHLGLEVQITGYGPAAQVEQAAAAAFARIATLEQVLSDWRPNSELNTAAAQAALDWYPISRDLGTVLKIALEVAAWSDGAFDPTIGALTKLWREERRTGIATDSAVLLAARKTVDWRSIQLDPSTHRLKLGNPETRLDLGGIAKGWILQEALRVMSSAGVSAALIEAGGDLVAGDPPPGSAGWRVNVRTTHGDSVVVVHRAAMATSGPSAQSIRDWSGAHRSHVIDPATGIGLTSGVEVTVLGRDGATADAVATALTVMPESKWAEFLHHFQVELVAVVKGKG
jgi:thiamine biosynthesis lipoprotein